MNPTKLAALLLAVTLGGLPDPAAGQDPTGTRLIYSVRTADAIARGVLPAATDTREVMRQTISILSRRLELDCPGAVVQQQRHDQVVVLLPKMAQDKRKALQQRIEAVGFRLEMRVLADDSFDEDGVTFDLAQEKKKLEEWLAQDDNRAHIINDPLKVHRFNALTTREGGRLSKHVRWYPVKVFPSFKNPKKWDTLYSKQPNYTSAQYIVPVMDDNLYRTGPEKNWVAKQRPFLVELMPINMKEVHFTGESMDASGVSKGIDQNTGAPCVYYKLNGQKAGNYADWTSKYKGKPSAIILNGIVRSAPTFQGRIYGTGIITGSFTAAEAQRVANDIVGAVNCATGPLPAPLELVSSEPVRSKRP